MELSVDIVPVPKPILTGRQLTAHLNKLESAKEDLKHLEGRFEIVTSREVMDDFIETAIANGVIALDTETTGLDEFRDTVVGVSLATYGRKAIYIPIAHRDAETGEFEENQADVKDLMKILSDIRKSKMEIVMHNANFDSRMMWNNFGIRVTATWDTGIMSRLLNENETNHSLKYLYDKYISKDNNSRRFNDLFSNGRFDVVPIEIGYIYAANDALITLELYDFQKSFVTGDNALKYGLETYLDVFRNIEMKLQPIVMDIEELGVQYDPVYGAEMERVYEGILEQRVKEFNSAVMPYKSKIMDWRNKYATNKRKTTFEKGKKLELPVNWASWQQLSILLYDIIGLDNSGRPKGKERSTDKKFLKKYDHPVVKALQAISEVEKQLTTYIRAFPVLAEYDGRIHTHFNQVGTVTQRFSSRNTNLQNISAKNGDIRKAFVATDGYSLISCDYSKQEIVVATEFANDEMMRRAFDRGQDVYSEIASLIFHVPYEECTEDFGEEGAKRRYQAKQITLSLLYGKQSYTLAKDLGITTKEAEQLIEKFFDSFSGMREWITRTKEEAYKKGYVRNMLGIKRRLPDMLKPDYEFYPMRNNTVSNAQKLKYTKLLNGAWNSESKNAIKEQAKDELILIKDNTYFKLMAERQCINAPIQSTASYMLKKAMIAIHENEELRKLGYRILIPIHDEILGEAPTENAEECAKLVSKIMVEVNSNMKTPISVDIEISQAWQEKESYTFMTDYDEEE